MYNIKQHLFEVEENRVKLGGKLKHLQFLTEPAPFISEPMPYSSEPMSYSSESMPLELAERPEDDIAAMDKPSRHVDYLSHEWTEEDIWSSYKFIKSKRRTINNSERLENASWRTWEQKRRNLKTISPETVKWLKDNDVTWLYGPLQSNLSSSANTDDGRCSSLSDSCNSLKKPCLKRRSLAESMFLRSVSASSLRRPSNFPTDSPGSTTRSSSPSDLTRSSSTPPSRIEIPTSASSRSASPLRSQTWPTKSVRFHDKVEQRVTLSHSGDDESESSCASESDDIEALRREATEIATKAWLSSTESRKSNPPSRTIEQLPYASLKSPACDEDCESDTSSSTCSAPVTPVNTLLEDDAEFWKPSEWLLSSRGSESPFHNDLDTIKSQSASRPALDFSSPTFQSFSSGSFQERDDSCWSADMDFSVQKPDYYDHLDFESGSDQNDEYEQLASMPVLNSAKAALVNRIMDQFWIVFNAKDYSPVPATLSPALERGRRFTFEAADVLTSRALADHEQSLRQSLPIFVRKRVEGLVQEQANPEESSILAGLTTIIRDCQDKVLQAYQSSDADEMDYISPISSFNSTLSPVTSSDSGYGSEPVRDTFREEKTKVSKDWHSHSTEWDDDEEAAWESSF